MAFDLPRSVARRIFSDATKRRAYHWRYLWNGRRDYWAHERFDREDFLRKALVALDFNGIAGDYAEFGCHGGMTFGLAHHYITAIGRPRHLWAFDSFAGLPPSDRPDDQHPHWVPGTLSTSATEFIRICRRAGIRAEAMTTVPGFYSDTIGDPAYAGALPADIALVYIDCDLLTSTATVLDFLAKRLKHGMIVAFDDYFCWDATALSGERAALLEFLARDDRFLFSPYQSFGWHGMSFVVEDRALVARHLGRAAEPA